MKILALLKIIVKEYKRDLVISILLLILIDFIYAHFTGTQLSRENGVILWQGGNERDPLNLSTVLLKLLNISTVFITVGKITDQLSSDIMLYILARITDYRKFMRAYVTVIILLGELLLTSSHIVYYCFAGFYSDQAISCLFYLLMDVLGFAGILLIYFILNHCYSLENSYLYIIAVYILNTVLPVPFLLAMSTVRFSILKSQISTVPLLLTMAVADLAAVMYYDALIQKRRINIC